MDDPSLVTAIATAVIAVFAMVQVGLEALRRREARQAAGVRVLGPAWILRAGLEEAIRDAYSRPQIEGWASSAERVIERLGVEERAMELLTAGSHARRKLRKKVQLVFSGYLEARQAFNRIRHFPLSGRDSHGGPIHTEEERIQKRELVTETLKTIGETVRVLETMAPRQVYEPNLPEGVPRILRE